MPLRDFLTRLIAVCILPLLLLAAWLAVDHVRELHTRQADEAQNLARNFARAVDENLQGRIRALSILAESPLALETNRRGEFFALAQGFQRQFGTHVILADPGMQMLFNTRVPLGTTLPALPKSRGQAAAPLALRSGLPAVGDIVQGPIAGEPLVAIVVPVLRAERPVALLLTTFETRLFQQQLEGLALRDGWSLTLADSSGAAIARRGQASGGNPARGALITAPLTLAAWSVSLQLPDALHDSAVLSAALALALALALATLTAFVGGYRAAGRLRASVATLDHAATPVPARPGITEIASAKRLLDQTAALQRAAESDLRESEASLHASRDALRESEARFRGLVEQAVIGIFVSEGRRLTYVNPRFAEILGYAPAEMIGMGGEEFVLAEDIPILADARSRIDTHHSAVRFNLRARRKDGGIVELAASGMLATYDGRPATLGMVEDITERRRAEARAADYAHRLEQSLVATVAAFAMLIELRDPITAAHLRGVSVLAMQLGRELGWDEERVRGLQVMGSLVDIGKIAVPAEVLNTPKRLGNIEQRLVQSHAQAGHDVLKDIETPWPLAEAVLQHHERLDGSGYPRGLKEADILPEARVLAVADIIDAMGSHRPWRPAHSRAEIVAELQGGRERLYDAAVVDAALRLLGKGDASGQGAESGPAGADATTSH